MMLKLPVQRLAGAALALALAYGTANADDYQVRNAAGSVLTMRGKALGTGQLLPWNGLVDPNGNPFNPANPLAIQPGISAVTPVTTNLTITTGGAAVSLAANTNRKGGWCYSMSANTGIAAFSLTGTATTTPGAPNAGELTPSGTFPFVQNGYVYQGAISFNSSVAGTAIACVEFQ